MSVLVLQLVEYGYELPFPQQYCCGKRLLPLKKHLLSD